MTGMSGTDCAGMCNLMNTHTHKHTHTLIPPARSTFGEVDIRQVEHRSEIHSNESQHLAERSEVARLR